MALVLGCASAAFIAAGPAAADPSPTPPLVEVDATGPYSGTVPDGACALRSTVLGGSGGNNMSGEGVSAPGANGSGASITTVYSVVPGMSYAGTVGGGGDQGAVFGDAGGGGSNGGGPGGSVVGAVHPGAGGGGWSDLRLGDELVVLAGGGGGSAGGHSLNEGFGGDAGLPTTAGVTPGQDGLDGREPSDATVGGGKGGDTDAPGAGGVNAGSPDLGGSAGDGRTGGAGGSDRDPDAGGGGGGGYFGGGGGASTLSAQGGGPPVIGGVAGAGGGGGSSYVAAGSPDGSGSPVDLRESVAGPKLDTAGDGIDGAVTLEWLPCDYDLAIDKAAAPGQVQDGERVTWAVTVRNSGPQPMTRGDVVTLTDSAAETGAATIESVVPFRDDQAPPGGTALDPTPLSCTADVGDPMPTTLECSRPYRASSSPGSPDGGSRGLDVGEGITVVYSQTITGAPGTTVSTTAQVSDRATGDTNDSAAASVDIADPPPTVEEVGVVEEVAPAGTPVVLDPAAEIADLDPSSVLILDSTGAEVETLQVPDQGTWDVAPSAGTVTFTPVADLSGDPDRVQFVGATRDGAPVTGDLAIDYRAAPDAAPDTPPGTDPAPDAAPDIPLGTNPAPDSAPDMGAPQGPNAAPNTGAAPNALQGMGTRGPASLSGESALATTGAAPVGYLAAGAGILIAVGAVLVARTRAPRRQGNSGATARLKSQHPG
ncbi:MAG: hypothetical protein ACRCYX_03260 [Dermatophilaceae bacterium]